MIEIARRNGHADSYTAWAENHELRRRIYASVPVCTTYPLTELQALLQKYNPDVRPKPECGLHLSLVEIGNVVQVHELLTAIDPSVPVEVSRDVTGRIRGAYSAPIKGRYGVRCERLGLYGKEGRTIGVGVEVEGSLLRIRDQLLKQADIILRMFGLPQLEAVLSRDSLLKRQLPEYFQPHISIAKNPIGAKLPFDGLFEGRELELVVGRRGSGDLADNVDYF
ncbi:MAG: hypothetical protein Q7S79_03880 [bacterium]|nr:hypothetical protein [bacterium]